MKNVIVSLALSLLSVLFIQETTQAQNFQLAPNGVTVICADAAVGETGVVNGITYTKRTREQITDNISLASTSCTTGITDMSSMFRLVSGFNEDLSTWDVSDVTTMQNMFQASPFNGDISKWDVSNVNSMQTMFYGASTFNQDISDWDVSNVTNMTSMFRGTQFNQDISGWCVWRIGGEPTNFAFNGALASENYPVWGTCPNPNFYSTTNNVTVMCPDATIDEVGTVNGITYTKRTREQIIADRSLASTSCTSGITDMSNMFFDANTFNEDISTWDVSNVTDMSFMFRGASIFNGDISNWDVSNATTMVSMFLSASSFNGDISNWDVSKVTDMNQLFRFAVNFDTDISNWNVSSVTNMNQMFQASSSFNGDISNWDVSNVTTMQTMFLDANSFNQDISAWDVSNVSSMTSMFRRTNSFNQDLSSWCVWRIGSVPGNFATDGVLAPENYPIWGTCPNPNFFPAANNVTVMCPDAAVDEIGSVNGITYTKRTRDQLDALIQNNINDPEIGRTCTSGITNMHGVFWGADSFNGDISTWDVSNVSVMVKTFEGATSFNGDISDWNVSSVTNMNDMFRDASSFNSDVSDWVVSSVTNMEAMFRGATAFQSDISNWNVSNVTNMRLMLLGTPSFNSNLANWDVSKVTTIQAMFADASSFNGDISNWDVANVENMQETFREATSFNGDISNWDVANVTTMLRMFAEASSFNRDISDWDVSNVENMLGMFRNATLFNQNLRGWCVQEIPSEPTDFATNSALAPENYPVWGTCPNPNFSLDANGVTVICTDAAIGESGPVNGITYTKRTRDQIIADRSLASTSCTSGITNMSEMFAGAGSFNGDISTWDVSNVTSMVSMFQAASSFNGDISTWDVSSVTTMASMFQAASSFNGDISTWDVSNVIGMLGTFRAASSFNGDLSGWDVSNVTNMVLMFSTATSFNGDIGDWDVSSVLNMSSMFSGAGSFNRDISNWDVSNVTNMSFMFNQASEFNQNLIDWCVENISTEPTQFANESALAPENYPAWGTCPNPNITLAANGVTVICTDAAIGDTGAVNGVIFTKRDREGLDTLIANNNTDPEIGSTCTSGITDMSNMFFDANTFNEDISTWDVSNVTDMSFMFRGASIFNGDISNWDVSNVTDMNQLFRFAGNFDTDISNWNVSSVTNMSLMFSNAGSFNGDISGWNVSNVTDMGGLFFHAGSFNVDISDWDVSSVTNMNLMFRSASLFNQNLSGWCVQGIPSEPTDFALLSALAPENYPTWGTCPVVLTASLTGNNEGWRILGAPVTNATYGELLSGLWTQGFPGASIESGVSNVYWYDETTRQFNQPANATNIIGSSSNEAFVNAGHGFVTYVYEDDFNDGTSTEWPKTIDIFGAPHSGEIVVVYSETILPENNAQGWHMASNPYPFPISWTDLVEASALNDMIPAIFVYDANANEGSGEYRVHYGFDVPDLPGSVSHDGIIAPFQGFWVRTAGTAPEGSITFRESYETTGGSLYDEPEQRDFFALSIEGESLEAGAVLLFDEDASVSTSKPVPFSAEMIRFGFMREGNLQPDVFRSTEAVEGDQLIIPLDFAAVHSGTYTLNLNGSGISEIESTVILRDHLTGAEHHLSADNPYTFEYETQQKSSSNKSEFNPKTVLTDSKNLLLESEHRFELHIQFGNATSTEPVSELPTVVALNQNYPNPFNPTTQIQYALPESGSVRLDVYNVMGQRVATLVNGQKPAGYHTITFDASGLASGTYLYRLQSGNQVITKKLMLVK